MAERDVIEAALVSFAGDWGMPGHPDAVPKVCYLRNTYASVDRYQIAAAKAAAEEEGERRAVEAIAASSTGPLPGFPSTHCKILTLQEVEKIESAGHVYQGAVLVVSHPGLDESGENAAVLLGEARADLAGSTWVVFLKKSTTGWSVAHRRLLKQS
jgi:hypothetical protein